MRNYRFAGLVIQLCCSPRSPDMNSCDISVGFAKDEGFNPTLPLRVLEFKQRMMRVVYLQRMLKLMTLKKIGYTVFITLYNDFRWNIY